MKNKNIDLTKEKALQLTEFKVLHEQLVKDLDKELAEVVK